VQIGDAGCQAFASIGSGDQSDQRHPVAVAQHFQREARRLDPLGVAHVHVVDDAVGIDDVAGKAQRMKARGFVRGGACHQNAQPVGTDFDPVQPVKAHGQPDVTDRLLLDHPGTIDGGKQAESDSKQKCRNGEEGKGKAHADGSGPR